MFTARITALLFTSLVLLVSCDDQQSEQSLTVEAEISNTEIYEYNTGMGGDEQGAQIMQHPLNYEISEMIRDASTNFSPIYRYKPTTGFVGTEVVKLQLLDIIMGSTSSETITTDVTIYITVTE